MKPYDPFRRGSAPVGVQTLIWRDPARERDLRVEVWYPANDRYQEQDLDPETQDTYPAVWVDPGADEPAPPMRQAAVRDADAASGSWPLILLAHGLAGFRQESSFLGTHLASHGYVVVSADFIESTYKVFEAVMASADGQSEPFLKACIEMRDARKADIPFLVAKATDVLPVEPGGVGVTGASLGGWTSLMAPSVEQRVRAVAPMCPGGGSSPIKADGHPFLLREELNWGRSVPTLMMVADRDSLLPLWGQLELFRRIQGPTQLAILLNADHNHFVDDIEVGQRWLADFIREFTDAFGHESGRWDWCIEAIEPPERLCPPDHAHHAWSALATAHFDAYLRDEPKAARYLTGGIRDELAVRGIELELIERVAR